MTSLRLWGGGSGPKSLLSRARTQLPLRSGTFWAARGERASSVRPREPVRRARVGMGRDLSSDREHPDYESQTSLEVRLGLGLEMSEPNPPGRDRVMDRREFSTRLLGAAAALSLRGSVPLQARLRVDGARIDAHLAALAEFGKNPEGGVTRVAYTDADRQGREAVLGWMREARLETAIDAAANLVGRRAGREPLLKPIALGSHV